jgi:hypothetical protein
MPRSNWNRAHTHDMVFVLMGKHPAAPAAIRAWIAESIRLGLNVAGDLEVTEAEQTAQRMEAELQMERCYDGGHMASLQ